MQPDPRGEKSFTICDPACGTGGFLMGAYEWLMEITKGVLEREDAKRIKNSTYYGQDLVPRPRRLALMNMFLHGVEPHIKLGDTIYEPLDSNRFDCILSNPPFGTKGAGTVPNRDDFTVETTNKQLNFLQHIVNVLKPNGRAAVVLPDNCLFEDIAADVFKIVMQDCNVHTILRLPQGTFTPYSQGVKANVVFLQKGKPTENTWIYDNRSNIPNITKKDRPLTVEHFTEFMKCYGQDPNGQSPRSEKTSEENRWKKFNINEIKKLNYKLDISWIKTGDEVTERSLKDLIYEIKTKTDSIVASVAKLQELIAGVEE